MGQWADSLLGLERFFLLQVAVLGALSTLLGTTLLALARRTPDRAALLESFGLWLAAAGALEIAGALVARPFLGMRDLSSAVVLDRTLWFASGALGAVAFVMGARAVSGWRARSSVGERPALRSVGSDAAIATHAIALALLAIQLATAIVR